MGMGIVARSSEACYHDPPEWLRRRWAGWISDFLGIGGVIRDMRWSLVLLFAMYACEGPCRIDATRAQINAFTTALGAYHLDTGEYPTAEQGLAALRVAPAGVKGWQGPYLPADIPNDQWRRPYTYRAPRSPGQEPEVTSLGRPD